MTPQSSATNVYEAFCAEKKRAYCATEGRCYNTYSETCRDGGYTDATALPQCVRTAQQRCAAAHSGDAAFACSQGAIQGARAPQITTNSDLAAMRVFPKPFADGMALAQNLCYSSN